MKELALLTILVMGVGLLYQRHIIRSLEDYIRYSEDWRRRQWRGEG